MAGTRTWTVLTEWAVLAVLYWVAAMLGASAALPPEKSAVVWPASGLALAALLLRGFRVWPGIWLGAFAVGVTTYYRGADWVGAISSTCVCIGIATGCLLEAWYASANLPACGSGEDWLGRPAGILRFLWVAVAGTLLSASICVTSLGCGQFLTWESAPWLWFTWWIRDLAGVLLITPLLVAWRNGPDRNWCLARLLEALGLVFLLLLLCGILFAEREGHAMPAQLLTYLVIPFILWSAIRFGTQGVTVCAVVVGTAAVCATIVGGSLFAYRSLLASLLALQFFLGFTMVTGLLLAAAIQQLRHTVEELDASERRYRTIAELIPFGVWQSDAGGVMQFLSRSFLKLVGLSMDECRRPGWVKRLPAEEQERTQKRLDAALATGSPWECEYRLTDAAGGKHVVMSRGVPLRNEDGGVQSWVGIHLDITARKQAEEALEQERVELERRVRERTADLTAANRALEHEIDDKRLVAENLRRVNRALRTFCTCSQAIVHAREEVGLLRAVCQTLVREGGYRMAWAGLAEGPVGAETLRPVVHAGNEDGYLENLVLGGAGEVPPQADPAVAAYAACKVRVCRDFAPDGGGAAVQRGFASALALPLRDDVNCIGVVAVYSIVRDAFDAEEIGLLSDLASDLSHGLSALRAKAEQQRAEIEKQRLQQLLYQSQKMESIGRLAGGIAHDFNNLLTPIIGYTELAREHSMNTPALRELHDSIADAADRAQRLTRQILALSRKQELNEEPVDINREVSTFERMLKRIIGEDIEVKLTLAPALAPVMADVSQIQQILLNLAVNARDAMPAGGVLSVHTATCELNRNHCRDFPGTSPGPHVMLTVSDTGCGIKEETMEHLFEPFFTTKGPGKGTGLGLATVYSVVKQHGGGIRVVSTVGKGTTFEIMLPTQPVTPGSVTVTPETAAPQRHRAATILVAEDDPIVRRFTALVLQKHGYDLLTAEDGDSALRLANDYGGRIDLLLTDVIMPIMNGRDLYLHLAEKRQDMRVLFMSGYTADILALDTVGEQAGNFLSKPFSMDQLLQKVRGLLAVPVAT